MTSTELLTLSARIAALEHTFRSGHAAQYALKQLYAEQERLLNAIEATQDTIAAGEDAEETLRRLSEVLGAPVPAMTALAGEVEAENAPVLQIGEVLVAGEPQASPEAPSEPPHTPAPQTASELAQAERQPALLADLTAHPASSSREVQARLGWALSTTSNWLTRLVVEGLLTVDQSDYPYRYSLRQEALPEVKDTRATPSVPEPTAPKPAPPKAKVHPRAALLAYVTAHGPMTAKAVATALGLHVGPCAVVLNALVRAGQLTSVLGSQPVIYAGRGTPAPRPTETAVTPAALHAAPDQAALNATMRANAALVLGLLTPGQEYTEQQLTAATGLALSHLRLALGNLQATGEVQRLDGVGTRALYRLEQLDLPVPKCDILTPEGERVAVHLAHVTARSASDTATNIASGLRLPRAEVDQALSVLNAQGRLAYTRVGNLVMYTLRNATSEQAAD